MQERAHASRQSWTTNWLVAGGVVAGPLFTLAWFLGAIGRPGYEPLRHPISSLSIGELGWTQTSIGFGQVAGLAAYAGLLQRITLTVGWAWLTLLAVRMLRFPQGDH